MASDPFFANVQLLCPFDGADGSTTITDIKGHVLTATAPAAISTLQSKWGGSSLKTTVSPGAVQSAPSADYGIDDDVDWCIEFWMYTPTLHTAKLFSVGKTNGTNVNYSLTMSSSSLVVRWGGSGAGTFFRTYTVITAGVWQYFKVSMTSRVLKVFKDGVQQGLNITINPASEPFTPSATDYVLFGKSGANTNYYNGYLDDFRLTIGNSRSATDLVVPTEAHPTAGGALGIIGNVTTTHVPSSVMSIVRRGIIGNITTTHIPSAVMALVSPFVSHLVVGLAYTAMVPSAIMAKVSSYLKSGFVNVRNVPAANMVYVKSIPDNWISKQYQCLLTGSPDLELPINSFNADLTVSGLSTLSVVVHGATDILSSIIARSNGDLVLRRKYVYANGSISFKEFMRMKYDTVNIATGARSGTTTTLYASKILKAVASKDVKISAVSFKSFSAGTLRIQTVINDSVSLGDRVVVDGSSFIVGRLAYNANPSSEGLSIVQYRPDGSDIGVSIGTNARLKPLIASVVSSSYPNYGLWKASGYFYNGIPVNSETVGRSFNLYYDSNKLLWYLDGYQGLANVPVYLSDGTTQATVTI
jgi:hypothetical protein